MSKPKNTELAEIDKLAAQYSDARALLTDLVSSLTVLQDALTREHMPPIRKAVQRAAEKHDQLIALTEAAPHLFVKPKSHTLHGIKVGYRKGSGKMEFQFEDEDTIAKIRKVLEKEEIDSTPFITVREKPNKEALEGLDGKQLAKMGISIEDTGDVPFVKPVDGAVDKIVKALLKEATEEA